MSSFRFREALEEKLKGLGPQASREAILEAAGSGGFGRGVKETKHGPRGLRNGWGGVRWGGVGSRSPSSALLYQLVFWLGGYLSTGGRRGGVVWCGWGRVGSGGVGWGVGWSGAKAQCQINATITNVKVSHSIWRGTHTHAILVNACKDMLGGGTPETNPRTNEPGLIGGCRI